MDAIRVGKSLRALRHHRGWTQRHLAEAGHVARSSISRIETGRLDGVSLRSLDRVANALGARLDLSVRWNGEGLDRLLDEEHAALVETSVRLLAGSGWQVAPEVSFNIWGERGSIDVLAFHKPTSIVLVVEVKSVVPDFQAMLSVLDRKARVAIAVADARGWRAEHAGRLLVVARSPTTYRRLAQHSATLNAVLPVRSHAARRWVASPALPAMSGLLVVSSVRTAGTRQGNRQRERVREARRPPEPCPPCSLDGGRAPVDSREGEKAAETLR